MRRRTLRLVATMVVTIVAALVLAACSLPSELPFDLPNIDPKSVAEAEAEARENTVPEVVPPTIHENGYLTVGIRTGTETAPLLLAGNEGAISGIDVDLASALADELGLQVRFVAVADVAGALDQGCDVVMGVSPNEVEGVMCVGSYEQSALSFFRKGAPGVVDASEVNGTTVAVQGSSRSERTLAATGLSVQTHRCANINECFEALADGTADYVLCDSLQGSYLAMAYDDVAFAGALEAPLPIGVGVLSTNADFVSAVDSALSRIGTNGVLQLILRRWVIDMPTIDAGQMATNIVVSEPSDEAEAVVDEDGVAAEGSDATDALLAEIEAQEAEAAEADAAQTEDGAPDDGTEEEAGY